jgi:hypothetical protein
MDIEIRDYEVISSGDTRTGVVAQELMLIRPDLVEMGEDGMYRVREIGSWELVKAIQEQQDQIEELRRQVLGESTAIESSESSESSSSILGNNVLESTSSAGILAKIQTIFEEFKDLVSTLSMTKGTDLVSGKEYLSIDSDVRITGDLFAKDLNIVNLNVGGNIQAGLITVDTIENSINVLGASCYNPETNTSDDVLCQDQTLYLQNNRSGNLDILDGTLIIEPSGLATINGDLEVTGTIKSENVETNTMTIKESKTPDGLTDTCQVGEMTWDQDYIYVCTSENTWRRSKLEQVPQY